MIEGWLVDTPVDDGTLAATDSEQYDNSYALAVDAQGEFFFVSLTTTENLSRGSVSGFMHTAYGPSRYALLIGHPVNLHGV